MPSLSSGILANMRLVGRRNPKTIAIIGAGRFGLSAAAELRANGHDVLLIDKNENCLAKMAGYCTTAIGNAEDPAFLIEAGIKDVDAVIIAIDEDESASNHTVINCNDLGLYVMATAKDLTHGKILERLGADYVIYPEHDAGVRFARMITRSAVLDAVELYDQVFMMEVQVTNEFVGKTMAKLDLPNRYNVQVATVLRGKETIFPVSGSLKLEVDDRIAVLGSRAALQKLSKMARSDTNAV